MTCLLVWAGRVTGSANAVGTSKPSWTARAARQEPPAIRETAVDAIVSDDKRLPPRFDEGEWRFVGNIARASHVHFPQNEA